MTLISGFWEEPVTSNAVRGLSSLNLMHQILPDDNESEYTALQNPGTKSLSKAELLKRLQLCQ